MPRPKGGGYSMNRRSLLKGALVAPVVHALAKPARASLPLSERDSIRHAANAAVYLARAESTLAREIEMGGDVKLYAKAAGNLVRASRDVSAIYQGLLGGLQRRPDGTQMSREDQLVEVWAHRNGALAESLETARRSMRDAHVSGFDVRQAEASLQKVDATLAYADPTPQGLLFGQTIPAVIGPHGDYYKAQWHLFAATHYFRDWAMEWVTVFKECGDKYPYAFAASFGAYALCVTYQYRAAALIAGIGLGHNDTATAKLEGLDQFCKALHAGGMLWQAAEEEGAPQFYHACMVAWAGIESCSPAYRKANSRLTDSWRNSDAGLGMVFKFANEPQVTRCGL